MTNYYFKMAFEIKPLKDIILIAGPASLAKIGSYLIMIANLLFISHLDDPV